MSAYNTDLKLSKTKVIEWYRKMGDRFSVQYIQKQTSILMHIISFFLWIGNKFSKSVTSRKEFMEDFTTTLYGRIYINYEIGNSKEMAYRENISHICHEIQHTMDFRSAPIMMPLRYVFSSKWRAYYEQRAFMTHVEYAYKYELSGTKEEKIKHLVGYISNCCDNLMNYYGVDKETATLTYHNMMNGLYEIANSPEEHNNAIVEYSYSVLVDLEAI